MKILTNFKFIVLVTASLFVLQVVNATTLELSFKKGEMICFVSSVQFSGQQENQKKYFQGVLPIASGLNVQLVASMSVVDNLVGEHIVPGFGIIKLPNIDVKKVLNETRLNEWQQYREMRSDIWEHLRMADYQIEEALSISFDSDKFYQMESFWVQVDKENEFEGFINTRSAHASNSGAKIIHQFLMPQMYETLGKESAPTNFIITQWDSKNQFEKFQIAQADTFKYLSGYDAWLTKINVAE